MVIIEKVGKATIYAKMESANITGSLKDRPALQMLQGMKIKAGTKVIESSSGNLAVALARLCAMQGIIFTAVVPDDNYRHDKYRLARLGCTVIRAPLGLGPEGTREYTRQFVPDHDVWLDQYSNPHNVIAHFKTGDEIIAQCPKVTHFVAGAGSGGCLTGAGQTLIDHHENVHIMAVSGQIKGLRDTKKSGWIPPIADVSLIDEWHMMELEQSLRWSNYMFRMFGIESGFSSGATYAGARKLAQRHQGEEAHIVFIVSDRWASTPYETKDGVRSDSA